MTKLKLVRITPENRKAFYDLFAPPFDPAAKECTWLKSNNKNLSQQQKIDAFLNAEAAHILNPIPYPNGKGFLFAHEGTAPNLVLPVAAKTPLYDGFIKRLRKMIAVEILDNGKSISVLMDPLPLDEEIAILFQAAGSDHWEAATAKTIPKTEYIDQLAAPYSNFVGLPMQLGITEFEDGTKMLHRFYMANDGENNVITAATLHTRYSDGRTETVLTNEDFLVESQFVPTNNWLAAQEKKHGRAKQFQRVTSSEQCRDFFDDEGQFSISKTSMDNDVLKGKKEPIIKGRFLQIDNQGNPLIQSRERSVLETLMYELIGKPAPVAPDPSPPAVSISDYESAAHPTKGIVQPWVGRDVKNVTKIADTVKVEFNDATYLVDSGAKLELHGDPKEAHLRAMVEHAKAHWNNKIKIDIGSDADKSLLRKIAAELKVDVVEAAKSAPARPAPQTAQAPPTLNAA